MFNKIWQLPQNLVGCILVKMINAKRYCDYKDATVYSWGMNAGLSLGKYIFIPYNQSQLIKHEYGHTIQSKYLGWFYLLIIGLPSIIWAGCFKEYRKKHNISYYSFYTEKWADKLGGVERGEP